MNKKAQGLSLNTIIVAIVVLIVLVVLIMVFTGYFGSRFTPAVTSCVNSGGVCQESSGITGAECGYNAFGTAKTQIGASCDTGICCARGLGTSDGFDDGSDSGATGNDAGASGNSDSGDGFGGFGGFS